MKRETAYGRTATGNYLRMPFNRCNRGSEQGLIDDPVLGRGRDPLAPLQDVINDEDDIVMPVDPRYLGLWLTGLFGDPDTSDNLDGSRDHECASGGEDLPSYTLQLRLSDAKNAAAGRMPTVTLTNELDGAVYAWSCREGRPWGIPSSSTDPCSKLSRDRWMNVPVA